MKHNPLAYLNRQSARYGPDGTGWLIWIGVILLCCVFAVM